VLEGCKDLCECEARLAQALRDVYLLGQLPFTPDDLALLTQLIREAVRQDISRGTSYLQRAAPTCLACFLVCLGVEKYKEGSYWPAVSEAIGVEEGNWQTRWGQFFIDFLRSKGLPTFQIEGALAYVTPILLHGGLPNSCLEDFFDRLLRPLVRRDLMDPEDPSEVSYFLSVQRDEERACVELEGRIHRLEDEKRELHGKLDALAAALEAYDDLQKLKEAKAPPPALEVIPNIPEDYHAFRDESQSRLQDIESKIAELERQRQAWQEAIQAFSSDDEAIFARGDQVEQLAAEGDHIWEEYEELARLKEVLGETSARLDSLWSQVSSVPWQEGFGDTLDGIPLHRLAVTLEKVESLLAKRQEDQAAADQLLTAMQGVSRARLRAALMAGSVGLVVAGAALFGPWRPTWPFALAAVAFLVLGGAGLLAAARGHRAEKRLRKEFERRLHETEQDLEQAIAGVKDLLGALPVSEEVLRTNPGAVYTHLSEIGEAFSAYRSVRAEASRLQEDIRHFEERLDELSHVFALGTSLPLNDRVTELIFRLRSAVERQSRARAAREELAAADRELVELQEARQRVVEEIREVEIQLQSLGGGDLEEGIRRFRDLARRRSETDRIRAALERRPDLDRLVAIVQRAEESGSGRDGLIRDRARLGERLRQVEEETEHLRQELAHHAHPFAGLEEPVRRYLLYGEEAAEQFLIASGRMMHQAILTGQVPQAHEVHLPGRVMQAFQAWWHARALDETLQAEEEIRGPGQLLRRPAVLLDPGQKEVLGLLRPQRFALVGDAPSVSLSVSVEEGRSQGQVYPLRLYQVGDGLVETEELEFPLPGPSSRYTFRLGSASQEIRAWKLTLPRTALALFIFDHHSGRLIAEDALLPRQKLWLLIHQDYSLEAVKVLSDEGQLRGTWGDYRLLEIDLEAAGEEVLLTNKRTRRTANLPLSKAGEPSSVRFVDASPVGVLRADGAEVYLGRVPNVRIPLSSEEEVRSWHVSVVPKGEGTLEASRHVHLKDLEDGVTFSPSEGFAVLRLGHPRLLGQRPLGCFKVRLYRPPDIDWRRDICIIPPVEMSFSKRIYLPCEPGEAVVTKANIRLPGEARFTPLPPARVVHSEAGSVVVQAEPGQQTISGLLTCPVSGKEVHVHLSIPVPRVRWRVQGAEEERFTTWNDTIEEVWLGDSAQEAAVVAEFPPGLEGRRASLAIGGRGGKVMDAVIKDRKARFDLAPVSDALRTGDAVKPLTMSLQPPDLSVTVKDAPLLLARTRWEAVGMQCVQRDEGDDIVLEITWQEKGKAPEKVLRLWRRAGYELIREQPVLAEGRATMVLKADKLPVGHYLVELAPASPWGGSSPSWPSPGVPNVVEVYIVTAADLRKGQVFYIETVEDASRSYKVTVRYRVTIIGKIVNRKLPKGADQGHVLVTATNEGWYAGQLDVSLHSFDEDEAAYKREILNANPVKIDYDASRGAVMGIEDRYGDGAMYCVNCARLYWDSSRLADEERRMHELVGPVQRFNIRWT